MRIGLIARSDNTGLGNQTLELANMLQPSKVLLIDSTPFNGNEQHPERYAKFNTTISDGFISSDMLLEFLNDIDIVFSCEIFYNDKLINLARSRGIKTVLQYNYELFPNVSHPELPVPDLLLAPSLWNIDKVRNILGQKARVEYLPPPTSSGLFDLARSVNLNSDHNRLLHIAGRVAAKDRNGTLLIKDMLKRSMADYELVIRVQHDIDIDFNDSRVRLIEENALDREDMYLGYDAMILPRRYAGLCLPMNEALLSGIPVFMPDISPNNLILPKKWLSRAQHGGYFMSKSRIESFNVLPNHLAAQIDKYVASDKIEDKQLAFDIGRQFTVESLIQKYDDVLNDILN